MHSDDTPLHACRLSTVYSTPVFCVYPLNAQTAGRVCKRFPNRGQCLMRAMCPLQDRVSSWDVCAEMIQKIPSHTQVAKINWPEHWAGVMNSLPCSGRTLSEVITAVLWCPYKDSWQPPIVSGQLQFWCVSWPLMTAQCNFVKTATQTFYCCTFWQSVHKFWSQTWIMSPHHSLHVLSGHSWH